MELNARKKFFPRGPKANDEAVAEAKLCKARGNSHMDEGGLQEALKCYSAAIDLDQFYFEAYSNRVHVRLTIIHKDGLLSQDATGFQRRDKIQLIRAIKDGNTCISVNTTWAKGYYRLAEALYEAGNPFHSLEILKEGIKFHKGNRSSWKSLHAKCKEEATAILQLHTQCANTPAHGEHSFVQLFSSPEAQNYLLSPIRNLNSTRLSAILFGALESKRSHFLVQEERWPIDVPPMVLAALVEAGASVDMYSEKYGSFLHFALNTEDVCLLDYLLEKGVDDTVLNDQRNTALVAALETPRVCDNDYQRLSHQTIMIWQSMQRLLVEKGSSAALEKACMNNCSVPVTPLCIAAGCGGGGTKYYGSSEMVRLLLTRHADPNSPNSFWCELSPTKS
jgi:tetratricopeptide (TPR) repeat protein